MTEKKGIGQCIAHLASQITFLGAVRFVNHNDDVRTLVQTTVRLAEFVDGGDDDLAGIGCQEFWSSCRVEALIMFGISAALKVAVIWVSKPTHDYKDNMT
ncbi:hypothetical protein DSCW_00430 [Desulfosarcina widdelii]|uniref:Uncharacterized protein n=1 Tax=Desulfosarcina widdelii TaxID=947919 RepID=A0A5K7YTE4_9BACT|nr:hypothetical protein DSCW_00430 [Desulfosarcina widdelii]